MTVGIESIGIKLPGYALRTNELVTQDRATDLGCEAMGLCLGGETVVDLAVHAARRALKHWGGSLQKIGLLAIGTETSLDEARPLSAWVAEHLGLKGAFRSYEVKHACYGGTVALRQALEWKWSGAAPSDHVALVIAADVCSYASRHPAEVTQGAGAIAFIVGDPKICRFQKRSYCYSESVFDFWRPTGEPYPRVHAKKSVDAYCRSLVFCVESWIQDQSLQAFERLKALCFHVPFPRLMIQAVRSLCHKLSLSHAETEKLLQEKIWPYCAWNRQIGNAYTASLWISFAQALKNSVAGDWISAFSYGSGCGAELLLCEKQDPPDSIWAQDVDDDLQKRSYVSLAEYRSWKDQHKG